MQVGTLRTARLYGRPGKAWEPSVQEGREVMGHQQEKNLWDPRTRVMGDEKGTGIQYGNLSRGGTVTDPGGTGFEALYREVACPSSL